MTIQKILLNYKAKKENILDVLHEVMGHFGYISKRHVYKIADYFDMPASKLYGIISAGEDFKTESKKQLEITVCTGSNCKIKGAGIVLKEVEKYFSLRADKSIHPKINLKSSSCRGRCNRAPIMIVNGTVFERVKPHDVDDILRNYM